MMAGLVDHLRERLLPSLGCTSEFAAEYVRQLCEADVRCSSPHGDRSRGCHLSEMGRSSRPLATSHMRQVRQLRDFMKAQLVRR